MHYCAHESAAARARGAAARTSPSAMHGEVTVWQGVYLDSQRQAGSRGAYAMRTGSCLLGLALSLLLSHQPLSFGPAGAAAATAPPRAPQPALLPHWPPSYNMSESSVVQPCNYSGLYDYDAYPELAKFGLVDYDCAFTSRMVLMPPRLACGVW